MRTPSPRLLRQAWPDYLRTSPSTDEELCHLYQIGLAAMRVPDCPHNEEVLSNISKCMEAIGCADIRRGKTRAHKLKKIPGTPVGCPWDTRRDKQGSTGRCPRDFLLFTIEKRTEKGVPGTPGHPGGFQKIYVIFSHVPFLLPILEEEKLGP